MTKTNKIILAVIIAVVVVGGGYLLYQSANPSPSATTPIRIGVLADLSGDYANVLRGAHRGAELAVEDLQKEIDNKIELIIEDQKSCDSKETVTIMNKFVSVDKVDVIIGGTCSNTTLAAAPVAEASKTVLISPASSAAVISQAGDYVFRTYISDAFRGSEITRLAYNLGKRRMAIIADVGNDSAVAIGRSSKDFFEKLGGNVVIEEEITKNDQDFRTQLTKIKAVSPDVLYVLFMGPGQIGLIAKQAKEIGLDIQIIMPNETVEGKESVEIAKGALENAIYVMPGNPPETPAYQKLKNKYLAKYGEDEMPSYVTESYDAVMLGIKAVLASNGTKEDIKNKLYDVSKAYQGVSGNVTFDANGDVTKPLLFKTVKNGQFVLYK